MSKDINPILAEHYKTEEYKFHQQVLRDFEKMSREQRIQTLIDAGIYDKNLELTERYGGKDKVSSSTLEPSSHTAKS